MDKKDQENETSGCHDTGDLVSFFFNTVDYTLQHICTTLCNDDLCNGNSLSITLTINLILLFLSFS